jgi:DNA-binding transcriptional MerR regulator
MRRSAEDEGLPIGELAVRAGLTVRTLHHYDRIGLLPPAGRTAAGHRRYADGDVRRLFTIVALRRLGLPLADIAHALDRGGFSLRDAVAQQIEAIDGELDEARRLRRRLGRILDELDRSGEPSSLELIDAMEAMTMYERYYTEEQLERLERRAEELGPDAIEQGQQDWAELLDALRAERNAGTDPADPKVRALAKRSLELVEAFTGGDAGIRESLGRMYANEDPAVVSHGTMDRELMAYLSRAQAALGNA